MKIVALSAIALLLSQGCSTTINGTPLPIYDQLSFQTCNDPCPDVEKTASAIAIVDRLLNNWHYDHPPTFERVHIEWNAYAGGPLLGLTTQPNRIKIWDSTPGDVAGSALAHELIHVALWSFFDDPDAEHQNVLFDNNDGSPSLEEEARLEIIAAEL